jgi:hypothetical protein
MDSEIPGYVAYVATKIAAYASWCYLGGPALRSRADAACEHRGDLRGRALPARPRRSIGIFFAAIDMNNATRNAPLTYVAVYVPVRIVEWSLWYALIRRRSTSLARIAGWIGGGVLVSCVADVPLGILEGGIVPVGRPFC